MKGTSQTGVSVIVCCYNSAARLPETLKHLARQSVPDSIPWEVIVVNNASTDATASTAMHLWREAGAPALLRVVEVPTPGKSFALDVGYTEAHCEVLVTVDDDNWLDANYLSLAYEVMRAHPEIGALGGEIKAAFESDPPKWFGQMQSWYAVGPQGKMAGDITDYRRHVAGAGMVLRKSTYLELKKRNFTFMLSGKHKGEDTELCLALVMLGYRVWYDPRLRLTHFVPETRLTKTYLRELMKNSCRVGDVIAIYEMALARERSGVFPRFLSEVKTRGWWAAKSAAKLLIGRCHPFAFELELTQLLRRITSFREMSLLYRRHSGAVQALLKS